MLYQISMPSRRNKKPQFFTTVKQINKYNSTSGISNSLIKETH